MAEEDLDREEQDILAAYDADQFESVLSEARRASLVEAAEASFRKDRRINIRISSRDLGVLQRRAMEEGIPYQTLVSSILHKYASGSLRDVSAKKASNESSSDS